VLFTAMFTALYSVSLRGHFITPIKWIFGESGKESQAQALLYRRPPMRIAATLSWILTLHIAIAP
jgi:hypothetical protein